eukprot:SAG11_NODE_13495_length_653_cov_0.694946_2_plen_90_part_01
MYLRVCAARPKTDADRTRGERRDCGLKPDVCALGTKAVVCNVPLRAGRRAEGQDEQQTQFFECCASNSMTQLVPVNQLPTHGGAPAALWS